MTDQEKFDRPFLSPSEWHIYLAIAISSKPLSVREIVLAIPSMDRFRPNVASVSALLHRLEQSGYVTKDSDHSPTRYRAAVELESPFRQHAARMIRDLTQMRADQLDQLASIITQLRKELHQRRQPR